MKEKNTNLYWSVYKNLERELIRLSELIHLNDSQLDVYSVHIAGLLIRTVVEIEALAKELYLETGGVMPQEDKDLYFDTDCLKRLNDLWSTSKKVVMVAHPNFNIEREENLKLTPLHKAHKRGTSGADWARNYQAVKHNRLKCLERGNIKSFVRALAALFLLNVYYRDFSQEIGEDKNGATFDNRLGSEVFSIKVQPYKNCGFDFSKRKIHFGKTDDFEECTYLIKTTDKSQAGEQQMFEMMADIAQDTTKLKDRILILAKQQNIAENDITPEISNVLYGKAASQLMQEAINANIPRFQKAMKDIRYEVVLNKNQDCFK